LHGQSREAEQLNNGIPQSDILGDTRVNGWGIFLRVVYERESEICHSTVAKLFTNFCCLYLDNRRYDVLCRYSPRGSQVR